jgi:hypothetical protein
VTIKHFLIIFLLFNITLAVAPSIAQIYYTEKNLLIPHFWMLFGFFSVLTSMLYLFAHWRMGVSNTASGQALLISITLRLFICMIVVFIYLSETTVNPAKFLLNFFYLYLFHMVFEIYCLLCNLRNQKLK